MFLLKPRFSEEGADIGSLYDFAKGVCFCLHIAALETEDAVWKGVMLLLGYVLADNLHEVW